MRSKEFPYMKNLNKKTVEKLVKYECRIVEGDGRPENICPKCGSGFCVCKFQNPKRTVFDTKQVSVEITCDL